MKGIIGALLCTFLVGIQINAISSQAIVKTLATSVLRNDEFHVVAIRGQNLQINRGNMTVCKKNLNFFMESHLQATVAKNGRIVFWGVQNHDTTVHPKKVNYVVGVIDINNCNETTLKYDVEANVVVPATVITNDDSFDVFLPTQKNCNPCRHDYQGKQLPLAEKLPKVSSELLHGYHISKFVDLLGNDVGYFFAHNLLGRGSEVQLLDLKFKPVRTRTYENRIELVDTNFGLRQFVGICYSRNETGFLHYFCESLNNKLEPDFIHDFIINPDVICKPQISIDDYGQIFIIKPYKTGRRITTNLSIDVLDKYEGFVLTHGNFKEIKYDYIDMKPFFRGKHEFCVVTVFEKALSTDIFAEVMCKGKPYRAPAPLYSQKQVQ